MKLEDLKQKVAPNGAVITKKVCKLISKGKKCKLHKNGILTFDAGKITLNQVIYIMSRIAYDDNMITLQGNKVVITFNPSPKFYWFIGKILQIQVSQKTCLFLF